MTAGVAVVFKEQFGKPAVLQRLTRRLALQNNNDGASICSLITKERYFWKPKRHNYKAAFDGLIKDLKGRGLKHLVCTPIGCVQDKVDLYIL